MALTPEQKKEYQKEIFSDLDVIEKALVVVVDKTMENIQSADNVRDAIHYSGITIPLKGLVEVLERIIKAIDTNSLNAAATMVMEDPDVLLDLAQELGAPEDLVKALIDSATAAKSATEPEDEAPEQPVVKEKSEPAPTTKSEAWSFGL